MREREATERSRTTVMESEIEKFPYGERGIIRRRKIKG